MSFIIWMTGLPCSGKTTIAKKLSQHISKLAILDGDEMRELLSPNEDFSRKGINNHNKKVVNLAKLLLDHNVPVCVPKINPFVENREDARKILKNHNFIQVYIKCSLDSCEKRDVRGMYKKARINEKIPTVKPFDIVVLFHTLEHIIDPVILLKNIKKLLKPKGKVLVEVPNCDDFHLGLNKFYKEFYWERAHIHYFNSKSLKTVINLGGFKGIKITGVQRYSIENFFHWRLKNKPQMENPTYSLSGELNWLDESYKKYLERNLICDTLISIANI